MLCSMFVHVFIFKLLFSGCCLQVKLRLSMPSLQYKESQKGKPQQAGNTSPGSSMNTVLGLENSSSMDICSFQLCFAAHLVKTLLTSSPELDSTGRN